MAKRNTPTSNDTGFQQIADLEAAARRPGVVAVAKAVCDQLRAEHLARQTMSGSHG
jgi:hypothetical protein